jgi:glycosyltransferase involved in cell wall biosynthesis
VIVHNPGAAQIARAHGAERIYVIPHFFEPRPIPDAAAAALFRQRIGVDHGTVLFGIFGYLRETKRVLPCIHVFRRLRAAGLNVGLLIAGEAVSPDFQRMLAEESGDRAIRRTGHLSESDLTIAGAAVDCCLNLRYPAAGETSGIAIRLMGLGRPVVLTAAEESAAIPDTAALRVPPGIAEEAGLFDTMAALATFRQMGREIGKRARLHVLEHHSLRVVAQQYWRVIREAG